MMQSALRLGRGVSGFCVGLALLVGLAACAGTDSRTGPARTAGPAATPFEQGQTAFRTQDYETAFVVLEPLATDGHPDAAFLVAEMYDFGLAVAQDYQSAAYHYEEAAKRGHAAAQYRLAERYDTGVGVMRSKLKALTWYMVAERNPSLHWQDRYQAGVYLRTHHSVHVLDNDAGRVAWNEARRLSEQWQPKQR